jgi:hypothetical protein
VGAHDEEDDMQTPISAPHSQIPSSPPPSFRSRTSSPASRRLLAEDPLASEADQTLADTFDDGNESDGDENVDQRQRVMRGDAESTNHPELQANSGATPQIQRRVMQLPFFTPSSRTQGRGVNRPTNDGVFANLAAKPERAEALDEKPPVRFLVFS